MHRTARCILAAALFVCAPLVRADDMKPLAYPETRRDNVAEVQFGERIADPIAGWKTTFATILKSPTG